MIRRKENHLAWKAGALALLVHGLFFVLLVVSFSWKTLPQQQIAQVELWDSLPQPHVVPPQPKPEPKPEPPPPPKPEPKPVPPPPPEPKAEIQIKPKPPVPEVKKPPKVEPKKPDPALKAKEEEKKRQEEIRKLQQMMLDDKPKEHEPQPVDTQKLAEAKAAADAKRAAEAQAASAGVINDFRAKIVAKIKPFVNRQLCGNGKPELKFAIALMPTGELSGTPRLTKSSGIPACDDAVARAILQAVPLPLPPQPELFAQFRDLELKFRPNDDQ